MLESLGNINMSCLLSGMVGLLTEIKTGGASELTGRCRALNTGGVAATYHCRCDSVAGL